MNESVVIIGGGMGGLFTGAFLAKKEVKVTVLEKNAIIGGGLQCFSRKGKIFETGMHVMGGFEDGGTLKRICDYLGIMDKMEIQNIDSGCIDEIIFGHTDDRYLIPSGRIRFTERLKSYFPDNSDEIERYVQAVYDIADQVPLFYLKEDTSNIMMHGDDFFTAADLFIEQHISNPKLRDVLAYFNPLYGGVTGHTPLYIHALITVLYINGSSRFVGGSQQMADALTEVIVNNGGCVLNNSEVTSVCVEDGLVKYVETWNGRKYIADSYICALHPELLLRLTPDKTFKNAFMRRIKEIPDTVSAFSLYLDLKPETIPYIDHTCYYIDDYGMMWTNQQTAQLHIPVGFMFMTPPDPNQGKYASRMLIHSVMDYNEVQQWENSKVGHRGAEYEEWKHRITERILDKLSLIVPDIKDAIANIYSSSPLTIRDYYGTRRGALFGFRKDCQNILLTQFPVFTKVRNLYLTGQNINLHGICGVPLTAINTAEAILGTNAILKDFN